MEGGIALLDKPAGVTSHDALSGLKRLLGTRRVGHTGTLDRFATGLLVVLVDTYTPLASVFEHLDKTYVGTVRLGAETETLDPEGAVVATAAVPDEASIQAALPAFRGEISQVPPAYSAIHVAGKRAYQSARDGQTVVLAPRTVTIRELEVLSYDPPDLVIRVRCTRGTYIRSLARDLGRAAGSVGHLVALRRTALGPIQVDEAVPPDTFDRHRDLQPGSHFFRRHSVLPLTVVPAFEVPALRQGRSVRDGGTPCSAGVTVLCVTEEGEPLALGVPEGGRIRPVRVLGR